MEYSVADTSEVQWVSAVLLQIFNCSLCMKQHIIIWRNKEWHSDMQ